MTKRKCEVQALVTLLPPCKKPLCSKPCAPDTVHVSSGRKRKLEPESGPPEEEEIPGAAEGDRVLPSGPPAPSSPPSCKKMRRPESPHRPPTQYKYQKDEAFPEYNSFQYWKIPLPDIDFSELSDELCAATSDIQEMDS